MVKTSRLKHQLQEPQSVYPLPQNPLIISQILQEKQLTLIKRKKIFIDSNFLIALYSPFDSLHDRAIILSQRILLEDCSLYLSNYIFLETMTVLSQKVNKSKAVEVGDILLSEEFETLHIDESFQRRSWQIFQDVKLKNMSFIDCSILACMEFEDIPYLLTFDQTDFKGFRKKYAFEFYQ